MGRRYCGNKDVLPDGYTRFGTRHECLKTGYGVCKKSGRQGQRCPLILLPPSERHTPSARRAYCGTHEILPEGYTSFGSRHDCLKKGFGVCLYSKKKFTFLNTFYETHSRAPKTMHEWLRIILYLPSTHLDHVLNVFHLDRIGNTDLYSLHIRQ